MDALEAVGQLLRSVLLTCVPRSLGVGLLGFVLGVGLMAALGARGVLRREPTVWRWATRLFYVWVPLATGAAGGALGAVWGAHVALGQVVDERLAPAMRSGLPVARRWLLDNVDFSGAPLSLDQATDRVLGRLVVELRGHPVRAALLNFAVQRGGRALVTTALRLLVERGLKEGGASRRTATVTAEALRNAEGHTLDEGAARVLVSGAHDVVSSVTSGLALQVLLLLLGAVAPLPLERLVYWLAWERRRKRDRPLPGGGGAGAG